MAWVKLEPMAAIMRPLSPLLDQLPAKLKLRTGKQWRPGDVALLEDAAARLGLPVRARPFVRRVAAEA